MQVGLIAALSDRGKRRAGFEVVGMPPREIQG